MKKSIVLLLVVSMLLTSFIACTQINFSIDFIVDGTVYDTITTNGKEFIEMPADPVKEGYIFKGWFWDNNVWEDPFTANSLLDVPLTANLKVYACWVDPNSTTVDSDGVNNAAANDFENADHASDFVKRDDEQNEPVLELSQTAIKNENFRDTMVSWYDDDYNYYVFNVGKIKNVPLTSTYTVFYYGGSGSFTQSKSVSKATMESIESSTSKAISSSVSVSKTGGFDLKLGAGVGNRKTGPYAAVEGGYSKSTTRSNEEGTVWTDTHTSCVSTSNEESNSITISFDPSCQAGNYMYLMLGHVNVYYAVVQPRNDLNTYYIDTYCEIESNKYVLSYTGENDVYPINDKQKIDVDFSFLPSLNAPTNYIVIEKPQEEVTYEDIAQTLYWDDSQKVGPLGSHVWWITLDDIEEYYDKGYNKIDITYKFYATGTKGLIGGYVNIDCYLSTSKSTSDQIYFKSVPSSKGKSIEKTVTTDLNWFINNHKIYLILENQNFTESFTVSKLTFETRIYKE